MEVLKVNSVLNDKPNRYQRCCQIMGRIKLVKKSEAGANLWQALEEAKRALYKWKDESMAFKRCLVTSGDVSPLLDAKEE